MKSTKPHVSPEVQSILSSDDDRMRTQNATFNPITGEGSIGQRVRVHISDFPGYTDMWLPQPMVATKFMRELIRCGSVSDFCSRHLSSTTLSHADQRIKVITQFIRLRNKHDFPFWAAFFVYIRPKKAGTLVRFKLNRPQRILVDELERQRLMHRPIRIIILKARQWGGSTCVQMYIAWLQLVHYKGASSAIEAHLNGAASNIQNMFRTMLDKYPVEFMHDPGESYDPKERKFVGDPVVKNVIHIPSRELSIQVGSAINPDSSRSFNVSFAHCSEVAIWADTGERTPQKLVNAVCSGILPEEGTLIAYESTAKGEENFFHDEYQAAKEAFVKGEEHEFIPLFIAWFQIENYTRPFKSDSDRISFADLLWNNRNNQTSSDARHESGAYLYWLFTKGATLEAINWYVFKRTGYSDHADMANEFPSDDIEAFRHSGTNVFSQYDIEQLRPGCRDPRLVGELHGLYNKGPKSLERLRFQPDPNGHLLIWDEPEQFDDGIVTNRYLVVVDIGGRWSKADYSVITVFDRYWMIDGDKPCVVAQWYGHIDHDILAWKSAQIARWYNDALLVIESNTLETRDPARNVDGDQSIFILDEIKESYDNLYAREQSAEDIKSGAPRKYGFHTNSLTKPKIISNLITMVRDNTYIERYAPCLSEYRTYQLNDGVYEAAPKHHDDLLMTRAIGLWICMRKMPMPVFVPNPVQHHIKSTTATAATIL